MIKVDTRVIGTAEIRARFLRTGDAIRDRIRRAIVAAGQDVKAAAQAGAPRKTGALANSIGVKVTENDAKMTVRVAPSKFYGRFLEFGVVAGKAPAQATGIRGFFGLKETGRQAAHRISHMKAAGKYRIQPRPFMAPAIDRVRAQIDASLDAALAQALSENS